MICVSKNLGRCTQRPYVSSSHAYFHLVMLNLIQHLSAVMF